jgi:hypothetical protein
MNAGLFSLTAMVGPITDAFPGLLILTGGIVALIYRGGAVENPRTGVA